WAARVWDAWSGRPLTPPLEHRQRIVDLAYSADGKRVVTASEDQTAAIWDAAMGRRIALLRHPASVYHVACDPQGKRVVTVAADGAARIWDTATGRLLRELGGAER